MSKNKKRLTWDDVLEDFKRSYIGVNKKIIGYEPYDEGEIKIFLTQNQIIIYNYDTKHIRNFE